MKKILFLFLTQLQISAEQGSSSIHIVFNGITLQNISLLCTCPDNATLERIAIKTEQYLQREYAYPCTIKKNSIMTLAQATHYRKMKNIDDTADSIGRTETLIFFEENPEHF